MSIHLPESNAQAAGNTANGVAIVFPAAASQKAANLGFTVGVWIDLPAAGYENNVNYNIFTRGGGASGGSDGYIRFNQACSQLTAFFRNSSTTLLTATTLTKASGNWKGKRILVMLIQTAANAHLVVCEPGSAPEYVTAASTGIYTTNLSASDCWNRLGPGNSTSLGHYGPVEEAFFITGEFPETAGVPDTTLIANIASSAQDLDTLHTLFTNGTKKWRYRMRTQAELNDSWGIAGNLTSVNTDANKVLLSGGPLKPAPLMPDYVRRLSSQVVFGTPGVANTAFSNIPTEGGSYSGIAPARIEARIQRRDGTTLINWQTVDPAPSGGRWAASSIPNVPGTAGWLTKEYRAVDGAGAQIGAIVASHGITGSGFNTLKESQSQGYFIFGTGTGQAAPADICFCATYLGPAGALPFFHKTISPGNTASRLAKGAVQYAIELHTLYPGWPISFSSIAVTGQSLQNFLTGGAFASRWGDFKSFIGAVISPYILYLYGHSSQSGTTVAGYKTMLGDAIAKATADIAAPLKVVHGPTARYADANPATDGLQVHTVREAIRQRVMENPNEYFGGSFNHIKNDSNDTGPHPMDGLVGQGRVGAQMAWGVMCAVRAVEDQPLTLTAAQLQAAGTKLKLTFDKVNA